MTIQTHPSSTLLGQCIRGCRGKKLADVLAGHAVNVVLAQRILGSRTAAKQLGKILFDYPDMSATPVDAVVDRVESGELGVTEAMLREAALADETAAKYLEQNPWLTDPTGKSIPRTKGRRPKVTSAPTTAVESAKRTSKKPPASTQPAETGKVAQKSESLPRQKPTEESDPASPPDDLVAEEPTVPEKPGKNGRKRTSVPMPPEYPPEAYRPKPPPPMEIFICGQTGGT